MNYGGGHASTTSRVAVGDFNGDGKADLAVANDTDGNNVSVLLGNGNGTFQAAVNYASGHESSRRWRSGTSTGTARPTWPWPTLSNGVSVLLGNGNGTFQAAVSYGAGTVLLSVAVGDFNGDGKADLAVANCSSDNVSVLLGNGDGTFQAAVNYAAGTGPMSVAVGDFNGDGKADLAVANYGSNNVSVLLGNGNGTFQAAVNYAAGSWPRSVAVGDFNGDGKADLAVANAEQRQRERAAGQWQRDLPGGGELRGGNSWRTRLRQESNASATRFPSTPCCRSSRSASFSREPSSVRRRCASGACGGSTLR